MPRTFAMPELAESVVEGEIVAWFVDEGAAVALDQPLVEVMTDKVTVEIPSPFAGVLVERLAAEGDVVPVGAPLARFEVGDEDDGGGAPDGGAADDDAAPADAAGAASEEDEDDGSSLTLFTASGQLDDGPMPRIRKPTAAPAPADASAASARPGARADRAEPAGTLRRATGPWGRPLAVPAARRLARELGVPLDAIEGSGPHGRIRVGDVESHAASGGAARRDDAGDGPASGRAPLPPYAGGALRPAPAGPETTRVPMRGLRRTIAKQLLEGRRSTVQTLAIDEADVSRLASLRARLKGRAAERGVKLSYLPFVLAALTRSLAAFPALNARWDEEANEIVRYRDAHLGVAVDTDAGLIVPVVRDASRRSVLDLGAEVTRLAEAARAGRLSPDEVRGGTFSVTNIGSVGGLISMPVLNAPEAGILGVHRVKKRPVVLDDDRIVARPMLYLSLTFDHRLVDGAEATRFLAHLIAGLEAPEAMLLGEAGWEDGFLDA